MNGDFRLSPAAIARLTLDTEPWLSCDDCFEQLDAVVESVLLGDGLSDAFAAHLRGCPTCREETRSLAALVGTDLGMGAPAALVCLDEACWR